jgi:hypothetical protein
MDSPRRGESIAFTAIHYTINTFIIFVTSRVLTHLPIFPRVWDRVALGDNDPIRYCLSFFLIDNTHA